ncbi:MAG: hypothetical protein AAFP84_22095, partial [Actinomycetota bacterium]
PNAAQLKAGASTNGLKQSWNELTNGFNWAALGFITAWGIAGAAVAIWRFRWEPTRSAGGGRRRRRGAEAHD